VSLGGEVFTPNFTEITESRRKNLGRMIYRQNDFKSFCREIILPTTFRLRPEEFYAAFEKLIA
jgi:hypothetical protein